MSQRKIPRHWKRAPKILKARYDTKSHYTAFDVCPIRLDGRRARLRRCGTLQGANRKEITKMLTGIAQAFACREIELGDPAGTTVEVIEVKEHQNV
jgi:hypothetical protein